MLCVTHDVTERRHQRATCSWAKVMILSESAPQSSRKTTFLVVAHCAQNVSFAANNVKRRRVANRSGNGGAEAKNGQRRQRLGERFSCLGDKNFCNAYNEGRIAHPAEGRRGLFSG